VNPLEASARKVFCLDAAVFKKFDGVESWLKDLQFLFMVQVLGTEMPQRWGLKSIAYLKVIETSAKACRFKTKKSCSCRQSLQGLDSSRLNSVIIHLMVYTNSSKTHQLDAKRTGEVSARKSVWWATLLCWVLLSYVLVYWVLHGLGDFDVPSVGAVPLSTDTRVERLSAEALQDALGMSKSDSTRRLANPNAVLSARIRLTGIVYEGAKRQGETHSVALLSLDQKPAKPYRVGMSLEPGLWVLSISAGQVNLGPDLHAQPTLSLDLPKTSAP